MKEVWVYDKHFDKLKAHVTPDNVNQRMSLGYPLLYYAIQERQPKAFVWLLKEARADPNVMLETWTSPLHCVAGLWDEDWDYEPKHDLWRYALCLIQHKADVNARDANGETPLVVALRAGKPRVVQVLLENGADLNVRSSDGNCVLHSGDSFTPREQHFRCMRAVLLAGGSLKASDEEKWYDDEILLMQRALAHCKLASCAVARALKHQGKVHRDVIPLIAAKVWATRDSGVWNKLRK